MKHRPFSNNVPTARGPKCQYIDSVAVRGWFRSQLATLGLQNSYQLQSAVRPESFRESKGTEYDSSGLEIHRSNTHLRYESGERFPHKRIVDIHELRAPGSKAVLHCPLYRVLKEPEGLRAWNYYVLPYLRPELRGLWRRVSRSAGRDKLDEWIFRRFSGDLLSRICILTAPFLLAVERRDTALAEKTLRCIVLELMSEQDSGNLGLFPTELYLVLQNHLFRRLFSTSYFDGYHFWLARSATRALMFRNSHVRYRFPINLVLFPGRIWANMTGDLLPGIHRIYLYAAGQSLHIEHRAWGELQRWPTAHGIFKRVVSSGPPSCNRPDDIVPFNAFYPMAARKRATLAGRPKGADIDSLFGWDPLVSVDWTPSDQYSRRDLLSAEPLTIIFNDDVPATLPQF